MHTLDELEAVVGQLAQGDQGFAKDLITKGKKYGLSPKQAFWVDKLYKRTQGGDQPPKAQLEGNLAPMMAMLTFAGQSLKHPKVRLLTPDAVKALELEHEHEGDPEYRVDREWLKNHTLRLAVAGERSRYHGKVTISDDHSYGWNVWYGVVDGKTGEWTQPRKEHDLIDQVGQALQKFSTDPVQAATAYGKLMGHCCFCHKALTDKRSVDVGYGGTCAKHYGLPWGKKA